MVAMTNRPSNRVSIALAIGFFAVLGQLGAFAAIASNAWDDLTSPSKRGLTIPFTPFAQAIRDELVFPVISLKVVGRSFGPTTLVCLRAVDLQTGNTRDILADGVDLTRDRVSNGEQLWMIENRKVFETNGSTVVKYEPKRTLGRHVTSPFIYEGRPALIETDGEEKNQLLVFVDGDWVKKGQIALPGKSRTWTADEPTGNSVLVPRTSANSTEEGTDFSRLRVVACHGMVHLFESNDDSAVCYRAGFDFVAEPAEDDSVSALAPMNDPADTTGWVLLKTTAGSEMSFNCPTVVNEELYVVGDGKIWHLSLADAIDSSTTIERVGQIESSKDGFANLVSSAENNAVYAISGGQMADCDVFRLIDGQLQKMPYHIEGLFEPIKRWIAVILLQGLAVLSISTFVLLAISAWMAGKSNYCFGCDSVQLAPIARRSMARLVDLTLIFGPLAMQFMWLAWQSSGDSFVEAVKGINVSNSTSLSVFYPAAIWLCVTWVALVISTGLWGLTPGKWLLGVRVIRKTLRPCGIFAALLRELLMCLDAPQLLTALPGLLCCLVTENGQRIGDLAAGTLVIDATAATKFVE